MRAALLLCCLTFAASAPGAELRLYTSVDRLEAQALAEAFEQDTGTAVRWIRMSAGEVLTRLRAERSRPQASVWFGGPSLDYMNAARDGLLEPYHPRAFDAFGPEARDPEWRWVAAYMGLVGFASNTRVLARRGVAAPTSWQELLQPALRGELSLAYAYTSGTAYTLLAALAQGMGEEPALTYLRALDGQVHHYNRSGNACVTQAALGEVGVCIAFSQDILVKGVKKGYPVVLTFPREGTASEHGGLAVVAGAPEREEAHRFVEWLLSPKAQQRLAQWSRLPIRPDVPADFADARGVRRYPFDPVLAASQRRRLVDRWREATGQ